MSDRPPPAYEDPVGEDPFAALVYHNSSSIAIPHPSQLRWPTHHPRDGTYYVVTQGHDVGILLTWGEAANSTHRVRHGTHQSVRGWDEAVRVYSIAHAANAVQIVPRTTPYRGAGRSGSQPVVVSSGPSTPTPGGPHHPITIGSSPAPAPPPPAGAGGSISSPLYIPSSPAAAPVTPSRPSRPTPSRASAPPSFTPQATAAIAPPFTQARVRYETPTTPTRRPDTPQGRAHYRRIVEQALSPSHAGRAQSTPPQPTERKSTPQVPAGNQATAPTQNVREATPQTPSPVPTPVQRPITSMSNEEFTMRLHAVEEALLFYTSRNGGRMPPPASPALNLDYQEARLTALETCVNELLTQEAMRVSSRDQMSQLLVRASSVCAKREASEHPPSTPVAGSSTGVGTSSHTVRPHSPIDIDDYVVEDDDGNIIDPVVRSPLEGDRDYFAGFYVFNEEQQEIANMLLDDAGNSYAESLAKGKGKKRAP